jgi:hypothetical protein
MDGVAEIGEFIKTESVEDDATISRTDGVELTDEASEVADGAARMPSVDDILGGLYGADG